MISRNRVKASTAPSPLFSKEPIPDGELSGADGRPLARGQVVRNPERYSSTLKATVPGRVGRIVEIYRCQDQVLVDAMLDGMDAACGMATWDAAGLKHSQARIRSAVDAMPSQKGEAQ